LLKARPNFGSGAADHAGVDAAAAAAAAAAAGAAAAAAAVAATAVECLWLCRWDHVASPVPPPNCKAAAAAAEFGRHSDAGRRTMTAPSAGERPPALCPESARVEWRIGISRRWLPEELHLVVSKSPSCVGLGDACRLVVSKSPICVGLDRLGASMGLSWKPVISWTPACREARPLGPSRFLVALGVEGNWRVGVSLNWGCGSCISMAPTESTPGVEGLCKALRHRDGLRAKLEIGLA